MKKILSFALALLTLFGALSLSSCYLIGGNVQLSGATGGEGDTYVSVEGGDTYDVTVNAGTSPNVAAASKALMSAVSVYCSFEGYSLGAGGRGETQSYSSGGSGVIYRLDKEKGDAYIITNYHVVYYSKASTSDHISDDITVYLYGQEYSDYAIEAEYVGGSMQYDIAVLKVEGSRVLMASNAVAATIANSDEVAVLETAIAIGNPEGNGLSATVGHVNVDSEYINMTASDSKTTIELRVIRTDAAVNSGNSGGGLFNDRGELIGIVNAKMDDSSIDNIGYAIPSNVAKAIAENILYYSENSNKQCVVRVIMGITVKTAAAHTEYDTESGRVYKRETIEVDSVEKTSVLYGSLKAGDAVNSITIDGTTYNVTRLYHVVDAMLNARVGSTVVMNITRDGKTMNVNVPINQSMLTDYN